MKSIGEKNILINFDVVNLYSKNPHSQEIEAIYSY